MSLKSAQLCEKAMWEIDEGRHSLSLGDLQRLLHKLSNALQADALRHAAEICRQRILPMKNEAHNIACTECSITLQAEAERVETGE